MKDFAFEPPYYAVIFTSQRNSVELGYAETADRMVELAAQQTGYLGVESARGADGLGITVSYWRSLQDIAAWRRQGEHMQARDQGRADWYLHYALRIAKVERAYGWDAAEDGSADPMLTPRG
ncbi:MAG: antibiotic biosynthesis monooxygenase [Paucibacter sp.]|nr:antibiotic biosynthesis monooxygenase [Roseateles sp.]